MCKRYQNQDILNEGPRGIDKLGELEMEKAREIFSRESYNPSPDLDLTFSSFTTFPSTLP